MEENQKPQLNWRAQLILQYLQQFETATEKDCTIRKTSQEICDDLESMGEFTPAEVTEAMFPIYKMGFLEDSTPVWLLKKKPLDNKLIE